MDAHNNTPKTKMTLNTGDLRQGHVPEGVIPMPPITHPGICEPKSHGFFWILWILFMAGNVAIGVQGDPGGYKMAGIALGVGIFWNLLRLIGS